MDQPSFAPNFVYLDWQCLVARVDTRPGNSKITVENARDLESNRRDDIQGSFTQNHNIRVAVKNVIIINAAISQVP